MGARAHALLWPHRGLDGSGRVVGNDVGLAGEVGSAYEVGCLGFDWDLWLWCSALAESFLVKLSPPHLGSFGIALDVVSVKSEIVFALLWPHRALIELD